MGRHLRKWGSFGLVLLAVTIGYVGVAPTAQADSGPRFSVTVSRHVVHSGDQVTVTATATSECQWILEWNGERRVLDGRRFVTSYSALQVSRPTKTALNATCFHAPSGSRNGKTGAAFGTGASGQRITVTVPPSWRHSVSITVLPPGAAVSPPKPGGSTGHPGGLPSAGGPALWALLTGLGALLVGSTAVRRSSRRLCT